MDTQPLADLLARRLVEEGHSLDGPIAMAELQQRLIPYRLCRAELRFATKAEYDLALLHLLGDEKQAEIQEDRLGEAIRSELSSPEPALRFLRRFAASEVKLKSAASPSRSSDSEMKGPGPTNGASGEAGPRLHRVESGSTPATSRGKAQWPPASESAASAVGEAASAKVPEPEDSAASETPRAPTAADRSQPAKRDVARTTENGGCRSCREQLPDVEDLRFCPHCGTDQNRWDCDQCQTEIQRPWQFCPKCGARQASS